jgi:hypothetical protein
LKSVSFAAAENQLPTSPCFEDDLTVHEPIFHRSLKRSLTKYEYFYGPYSYERLTT